MPSDFAEQWQRSLDIIGQSCKLLFEQNRFHDNIIQNKIRQYRNVGNAIHSTPIRGDFNSIFDISNLSDIELQGKENPTSESVSSSQDNEQISPGQSLNSSQDVHNDTVIQAKSSPVIEQIQNNHENDNSAPIDNQGDIIAEIQDSVASDANDNSESGIKPSREMKNLDYGNILFHDTRYPSRRNKN